MFNPLRPSDISITDISKFIKKISPRKNSPDLKHFLDNKTQYNLMIEEKEYIDKKGDHNNLNPKTHVNTLKKEEAYKIYNYRFYQSEARKYFLDSFKISECPICGLPLRTQTIDHILPKSNYIQYVVTPINLVPICQECNKNKGIKIGFNPYFEDFSDFPGVEFYVDLNNKINKVSINYSNSVDIKNFIEVYKLDRCIDEICKEANESLERILLLSKTAYLSEKQLENIIKGFQLNATKKWKKKFYQNIIDNYLSDIFYGGLQS